jgi:predicted dithiol-disulfide oxidoreductase (DUF899 family)
MFDPGWEAACPGCTASIDAISGRMLAQVNSRDTAFVLVSRAPYGKIAAAADRLGWVIPWYSSYGTDFNYDFWVTLDRQRGQLEYNFRADPDLLGSEETEEGSGVSCFIDGQDDGIFHTYSAFARGTEFLGNSYTFLDLTVLGRQEDWEEPKDRVPPVRGGDPSFTS